MFEEFKIYVDRKTGLRVLEVYSLDFISDRNHDFGWLGLHCRHFCIKLLLKWADKVHVPDYSVAMDLVKYYFCPRENIIVDKTILTSHKSKRGDADSH